VVAFAVEFGRHFQNVAGAVFDAKIASLTMFDIDVNIPVGDFYFI